MSAKRKGPPPIVYIVGVLVLGFGGYQVYQMLASGEENDIVENGNGAIDNGAIEDGGNGEPDSAELSDLSHRFSIGDKVLISSSSASQEFVELKEQGVAAIASQNYSEAVDHLEAALAENRNDPEALIYLNNARIGNDEAYDIAVPVPIDADTVFFSLEMLRGYAQAQNEINEAGGVNGTPIRLTLVNDSDRAREATEIAQELGDRDNILAVTGHWSSSTTLAAAPIYDQNELVLLNPVSTSTEISGISDYVFRTIPSNFVGGGDVNWATVMAYDSLNAIAEALEQDPTREGIRNAFSSDNFSAEGVVQPVRFLPSGDRDGQLTLVEVQPADPSRSGTGYDFVPLE